MRSCVLYVLRFPSRYARCLGEGIRHCRAGQYQANHPIHPLQTGVVPETLHRARYKFLSRKGGASQMRTVRPKEEKRVSQWGWYRLLEPGARWSRICAHSSKLRYLVISLSHRGHGAIVVETDSVRLALLFTTSSNVGDG